MGQIVSQSYLPKILRKLRQTRKRIAFTNGCFDILHPGHVKYLRKAKKWGDVLIVGLNSDSSVRKLKGRERPILAQKDRAEILSALESVNLVVIFSELTPAKLIRKIRPDMLIKGADYSADNIVGAEFVKSYGGKVKTIPLVRHQSSHLVIHRILRRYREK